MIGETTSFVNIFLVVIPCCEIVVINQHVLGCSHIFQKKNKHLDVLCISRFPQHEWYQCWTIWIVLLVGGLR